MIRRTLIVLSLLAVGGGVGFLFYHNAHTARVMLGQQSSLEIPVAAIVVGSAGLGAALVLLSGLATSGAGAWRAFLARRRQRKDADLDRLADEGREAAWAGENDVATRLLGRVVERRPNDLAAALALADAQLARGDTEGAQRTLESARSRLGGKPRLLAALGELALARGNPGAATDAFREAVQTHPTSPRLLDGLSRALAAHGQFDDAAATLQSLTARAKDPAARTATTERRLVLRLRGAEAREDRTARLEALRRLAHDAPDFVAAVVAHADALNESGDVKGCERVLRAALRRKWRGVLVERLLELQRSDTGSDRIPGILKDAANTPIARLAYARSLIAAGKLDLADSVLGQIPSASDGDPLHPECALVRGELALARGADHEAALALAAAARAPRAAFAHGCPRCGAVFESWKPTCSCGAIGTAEWIGATAVPT